MVAENLVDIYTPDSRVYDWFIENYPKKLMPNQYQRKIINEEGLCLYSIFRVPTFSALNILESLGTESYEVRDSETGDFIQVRLEGRTVLGNKDIREVLETL